MIATLNDVTPEMVTELRGLADADAAQHLRQLVKGREHRDPIPDFIRDVVRGGKDPATWGENDLLVTAGEADLTTSAEGIRTELLRIAGERWWMFAPRDPALVNRRAAEASWGAPGVLVRRAPYWWSPGGGAAVTWIVSRPLEPIADFTIAVRRWIAFRVAWRGLEQLIVACGAASHDARVAVDGLLKEARLPLDPSLRVPGFVGPDAWYDEV